MYNSFEIQIHSLPSKKLRCCLNQCFQIFATVLCYPIFWCSKMLQIWICTGFFLLCFLIERRWNTTLHSIFFTLYCLIFMSVIFCTKTIKNFHNSTAKVLRRQTTQENSTAFLDVKSRVHSSQSETKVVVAWLQDFHDHVHFPVSEVLNHFESQDSSGAHHPGTSTSSRVPEKEICIIFIHPLKTGMYRIKVKAVYGWVLFVEFFCVFDDFL